MLWDDETYEWLALNAMECGAVGEAFQMAQEKNRLPQNERELLIRSNFDSSVAELYFTSKSKHASDLAITEEKDAQLREIFKQHMEKHWPEWQEAAAKMTDNELLDEQAEIVERGDALGLLVMLQRNDASRAQEPDVQARMRRLVTEHAKEGRAALDRYSGADLLLLLSAKQSHLVDVSQRLAEGKENPMVGWKLKGILEGHVREVGLELQRKGVENSR